MSCNTVVCSIISRGIVFQLTQILSCGFSGINNSTSLKHRSVETVTFFKKAKALVRIRQRTLICRKDLHGRRVCNVPRTICHDIMISVNFALFLVLRLMEEILHHLKWLKLCKQWDNHHPWGILPLSRGSKINKCNHEPSQPK